ncbi:acyltransferase [uncultured Bacteroides sp.]|uniref:acyltransferase family protein n=1 Tax=uncultured Bacteroides sp. TaxID=162156 RepID=UPI002AAB0F8D|nr:acyltransferase [uncultured Bacteroides sp.]
MKQYDYITLSKALGIILVVVGHFTSTVYMPAYYVEMKNFIFSFHMPLFMILSGFLFQMSLRKSGKISLLSFLKKKFLRLMVPYFFISFAIAALNLVIGAFMPVKRMVDWHYLLEIFYTNVGGSAVFLWFMYTLFMIFVISGICMRFKKGIVILGALSIALYFIPMSQLFYLSFVHSFIVYFWGGMVFFLLMEKVKVQISAVHIGAAALILTLAFYFRTWFSADYIKQLLNLICGFAGSYLIVSVSHWLAEREDSKILMSLGKYSAYIYLLHMTGVYFIRIVYEKIGLLTPLTYGVALVAAVITGLVIPMLLTKYVIHKNKSLTFLMGGK